MLKKVFWFTALAGALTLIAPVNGVAGVSTPVRASALASPLAGCASQDAAQIAVTITGLLLIAAVAWFFFGEL